MLMASVFQQFVRAGDFAQRLIQGEQGCGVASLGIQQNQAIHQACSLRRGFYGVERGLAIERFHETAAQHIGEGLSRLGFGEPIVFLQRDVGLSDHHIVGDDPKLDMAVEEILQCLNRLREEFGRITGREAHEDAGVNGADLHARWRKARREEAPIRVPPPGFGG